VTCSTVAEAGAAGPELAVRVMNETAPCPPGPLGSGRSALAYLVRLRVLIPSFQSVIASNAIPLRDYGLLLFTCGQVDQGYHRHVVVNIRKVLQLRRTRKWRRQ